MNPDNPIDAKTKERILSALQNLAEHEQELVRQSGFVPKARLAEVLEKITDLTDEQKEWVTGHAYNITIVKDLSGKLNLSSEERNRLRAKFLEEIDQSSAE